jgi:hypothetical protein
VRFRPSTLVAVLLAGGALLLALGARFPVLVTCALVLDIAIAALWLVDVAFFGKLGFLAPDPASAELVFAVDASRLPRESIALARRAAQKLGAWLVAWEDLTALEPARLVIFTDPAGAEAAPADATLVLLRPETDLATLVASLEQKLRTPA